MRGYIYSSHSGDIVHMCTLVAQICRFLSGIAAMGYSPPALWLGAVLDDLQREDPKRLVNVAETDPEVCVYE